MKDKKEEIIGSGISCVYEPQKYIDSYTAQHSIHMEARKSNYILLIITQTLNTHPMDMYIHICTSHITRKLYSRERVQENQTKNDERIRS